MHDLDRQQLELHESAGEYGETQGMLGAELTENEVLELASEVLEVSSEEELEEFLGDLWNRTKAAASTAYNSPTVQKAIPTLKAVGRTVLPAVAGVAADAYHPGTGPLAQAGVQAALDQWLKEELEGLSAEDREFEVARRYVRFVNAALQRAGRIPESVPAPVAAQIAIRDAAREHLPGLVPFLPQLHAGGHADGNGGGRWVRQGSQIVIDLG